MGYWEQIGQDDEAHQQQRRRRDWPGLIAWPFAILFWLLVGGYLLKLFGLI